MDPPGQLGGVGQGLSFKEPPPPFLSGCPGSPTPSSLGCMELDIPKLIFWADLEVWLLVISGLAWGH